MTTTTKAPTFTQHQAERLFELVMDAQDAQIARGTLHPSAAHEIADGRITAAGEYLTECTCGRGQFRETAEQSQGDYALHVARALELRVSFGRAA